jgi:DNA polymerase I-like protein with 3'-5' exonuclease and polymerase domains
VIPNLRRMFVPPPGRAFGDLDLDSADLRIVTWESDCRWMKDCFADGRKPYIELAKEYYHDPSITKKHPSYPTFKKFCHGTNYLGQAATMAGQCGLLAHEADRLQKWYFGACPEIAQWQKTFVAKFLSTGTVRNAFGFHCKWFDRLEGNVVNEAVAWIPQSTVGLVINHGWRNIDQNLPDVWVHLQVHDSLVFSYPVEKEEECLADVRRETTIVVPYPDPLTIPVGLKTSHISWGDCA